MSDKFCLLHMLKNSVWVFDDNNYRVTSKEHFRDVSFSVLRFGARAYPSLKRQFRYFLAFQSTSHKPIRVPCSYDDQKPWPEQGFCGCCGNWLEFESLIWLLLWVVLEGLHGKFPRMVCDLAKESLSALPLFLIFNDKLINSKN